MPDSSCSMICVLRAILALKGVGSARASSNELVCRDWVPPNTAAMASIVVRTILLYGSWSENSTQWNMLLTVVIERRLFDETCWLSVNWIRNGSVTCTSSRQMSISNQTGGNPVRKLFGLLMEIQDCLQSFISNFLSLNNCASGFLLVQKIICKW